MHELPVSRSQAIVILSVAAILLFLAGRFVLHLGASRASPVTFRPAVAAEPRAARARLLVVDVVGAVRRAGLQRLPAGARVADAVARAGGATQHADLALVNLAAPVADGEQIVVPARGSPAAVPGAETAPGSGPTAPISLSTATAEQLDSLPGVGPVMAQKIVGYRQEHGVFHSVDELEAIPGIGPARLAQLKGLVVP